MNQWNEFQRKFKAKKANYDWFLSVGQYVGDFIFGFPEYPETDEKEEFDEFEEVTETDRSTNGNSDNPKPTGEHAMEGDEKDNTSTGSPRDSDEGNTVQESVVSDPEQPSGDDLPDKETDHSNQGTD